LRMWKALLITFVIAGAFAAESNDTAPGGPKEQTAGGHFYGNSGYGYQPPPPPAYQYPWAPPAYTPPLVDDYVCDIDASILVVTNVERDDGYGNNNNNGGYGNNNNNGYGNNNNGGYGNNNGGYGNNNPYGGHQHEKPNADRLKCAVIANFDEATCTSCCRIAARRDRSVASTSILGFIVDETQLDYEQSDNNNNGPYRVKRGAAAPETYGVPGSSPPRGASPPAHSHSRPSVPYYAPPTSTVFASPANPLGPKGRCVCCAPRKFGIPHFQPPRYGGGY
jgi:hypothetical protein